MVAALPHLAAPVRAILGQRDEQHHEGGGQTEAVLRDHHREQPPAAATNQGASTKKGVGWTIALAACVPCMRMSNLLHAQSAQPLPGSLQHAQHDHGAQQADHREPKAEPAAATAQRSACALPGAGHNDLRM